MTVTERLQKALVNFCTYALPPFYHIQFHISCNTLETRGARRTKSETSKI